MALNFLKSAVATTTTTTTTTTSTTIQSQSTFLNDIDQQGQQQGTTKNKTDGKKLKEQSLNDVTTNEVVSTNEKYSKIITDQRKYNMLKQMDSTTSPKTTTISNIKLSTTQTSSLPINREPCYVMGKQKKNFIYLHVNY
mgnify:CR=1 FL=1